jgi:hypothetical protein
MGFIDRWFSSRWWNAFLVFVGLVGPVVLASSATAAKRPRQRPRGTAHAPAAGRTSLAQATYTADENVGRLPITIQRTTALSQPEVIYYGVAAKGPQAGNDVDTIRNTRAVIPAGQRTYTFYVTVHDQGINGPSRYARAYIYGPSIGTLGDNKQATIELLQDDPLETKDPENPLGYAQAPTDGDPLQYVNWYVFGADSPAGQAAAHYASSNPSWAQAFHKIAYTPGSLTYRFWMWNQPAATLASTVEKYLADAEVAQPNTTVALSTYSLIHGYCESPAAIQSRFEDWITQLAHGIGNFRVVLYLEEDSLMETHCLKRGQLKIRLQELAYAVNALSQDPHLLVYMDAGAPDGWLTARQTANALKQADVAQAQGFFVNATHNDWTTTDVHYGQQIARLLGGKHFIVQTDDNGRGPLVPKDRKKYGNENLCNPPGRGTGPLTWNTGYEYVDGFLWFNNPGNSDGACGVGGPPVSAFWPSYAAGLVARGTNRVTGPRFDLLGSSTNM